MVALVLMLALPALAQQYLVLSVTWSDGFLAGRYATVPAAEQGRTIANQVGMAAGGTMPAIGGAGELGKTLAQRSAYQSAQTTALYLVWFLSSYIILVSVGSTALVARFVGA